MTAERLACGPAACISFASIKPNSVAPRIFVGRGNKPSPLSI